MRACGLESANVEALKKRTSMSRMRLCCYGMKGPDPPGLPLGQTYDLSALLWIGDRTRQPDHAHVEFKGVKPHHQGWPNNQSR